MHHKKYIAVIALVAIAYALQATYCSLQGDRPPGWYLAFHQMKSLSSNTGPVDFYAKVVDQNGDPVPNTNVHVFYYGREGSMIKIMMTKKNSFKEELNITTDENGAFRLSGFSATTTKITVSADGYLGVPGSEMQLAWGVNDANPRTELGQNEGDPAIFKLWSKQEKDQRLIKFNLGMKIKKYIGRPLSVDLISKQSVDKGVPSDLQITFNCPKKFDKEPFDWGVSLEAVNGFIMETNDNVSFLAAELNSQSKVELESKADATEWQREVKKNYYFSSRNGKVFGFIKLSAHLSAPDAGIVNLDYVLNPYGSQNLEADPNNNLTPKEGRALSKQLK